jgi:hypothetical protein
MDKGRVIKIIKKVWRLIYMISIVKYLTEQFQSSSAIKKQWVKTPTTPTDIKRLQAGYSGVSGPPKEVRRQAYLFRSSMGT